MEEVVLLMRAGEGRDGSGRLESERPWRVLGEAKLSWRSSVHSDGIVDRLGFQRSDDLSVINRKGLGTSDDENDSAHEPAEGARMVGY